MHQIKIDFLGFLIILKTFLYWSGLISWFGSWTMKVQFFNQFWPDIDIRQFLRHPSLSHHRSTSSWLPLDNHFITTTCFYLFLCFNLFFLFICWDWNNQPSFDPSWVIQIWLLLLLNVFFTRLQDWFLCICSDHLLMLSVIIPNFLKVKL